MQATQDDDQPKSDTRASARTVLVLGATGLQGGAVATALLARGWRVRALVRDPGSAKARQLSSQGVQVVAGDLDDPASVRAAMAGAHGVFSVQPSSGQGQAYGVTDAQEIRWGQEIADAPVAEGVRHLVYTSVSAAGQGPTGMGHLDSKSEIERHIRGLNLRATILRPATFMEWLVLPGMGLDRGVLDFFLRPDQTGHVIAVRDIGMIAAAVFGDPERFAGRTIEIAGDALTGAQLGETLSRAAGRTIACVRIADAVLAENPFLGRLASLVDDGRLAGNADLPALEREFGHLTSFEEWLSGPGKPLLETALQAKGATLALP